VVDSADTTIPEPIAAASVTVPPSRTSAIRESPALIEGAKVTESPPDYPSAWVTPADRVRELLAKRLVWILAATIILGFGLLATTHWTHVAPDDVRSIFELFFTALVTLVSSVCGFYYGSER
jgi:hypothetical protein